MKAKLNQIPNIKRRAIFITLEGLEGSGKSSVISFLARYLRRRGLSVRLLRDPGSTKIGEKIREILLNKKNKVSSWTELLLYLAARTQLIQEEFIKAFKEYDVVVCDRFYDSTIVYQGYALGLGKLAEELALVFSMGIRPDLTIVLDSNVRKSLKRIKEKDRIESRALAFHYRLRKGYQELAKKELNRIRLIDADRGLEEVYGKVKDVVEEFFRGCKPGKRF
jgi:dTMP kinase